MEKNVGKKITDFYCNGFAGRRYDLAGSIIESEGKDWIVIRTTEKEPVFLGKINEDKQEIIDNWTSN
jgi:hypothetical protein